YTYTLNSFITFHTSYHFFTFIQTLQSLKSTIFPYTTLFRSQKGNKATGYISGTLLGALTPFCSCSTIPILAGLLSSGAPFGPSISFLISSPLLNPVIVILLWKLLGFKLTAFYVIAMFIF